MIIDAEGLRAFVAVVDCASFSRAAEQLHLSQPAVSKRVEMLERRLGVRLLDRLGKQFRTTPAGALVLARARRVLDELKDLERSLSSDTGLEAGVLRFGASHHIGLHRLPQALERFHRLYPGVRLDLQFLDSERGCAGVEHGDLEFAAVTLPAQSTALLDLIPVWSDPLAVVVGREHALAGRRTDRSGLFQYPALLPAPGTFTRRIITEALALPDLDLEMTSNHLEVLKVLTAIGLGWSALPRTLIDGTLEVVHIENVNITRTLGIATRHGRTLSNAAKKMIALIREVE